MAVQILNDMPDAAVHRGDTDYQQPREPNVSRLLSRVSGRAVFLAATIAVHVGAAATFIGMRHESHVAKESEPIIATMIDAPQTEAEAPPEYVPPPVNVVLRAAAAARTDFRKRCDHSAGSHDGRDRHSSSADGAAADGRRDRICARTRAAVSARVAARPRTRNGIAACSRGRARPPRADPGRTIERLLPPRRRRAQSRWRRRCSVRTK